MVQEDDDALFESQFYDGNNPSLNDSKEFGDLTGKKKGTSVLIPFNS